MNIDMMEMLIERLIKPRFYKISFALLMVHRDADFMDSVFKTILLEMILDRWKCEVKNKGQFIRD